MPFMTVKSLRAEYLATADHFEQVQSDGAPVKVQVAAARYAEQALDAYIVASKRHVAATTNPDLLSMQRAGTWQTDELPCGAILATADGPAGMWFAVSTTTAYALGAAIASSAYGDAQDGADAFSGGSSMDRAEAYRLYLDARADR